MQLEPKCPEGNEPIESHIFPLCDTENVEHKNTVMNFLKTRGYNEEAARWDLLNEYGKMKGFLSVKDVIIFVRTQHKEWGKFKKFVDWINSIS